MLNSFHTGILPALLWLFLLAVGAWFWSRKHPAPAGAEKASSAGSIILLAMLVFMLSDVTDTIWFYFFEWQPEEQGWAVMTKTVAGRMALITLLASPLLIWRSNLSGPMLAGMALYFPLRCIHNFWNVTGGQVLSNDDHPSFLFRLFAYQQTAPHALFYNPYWNGGKVEAALAVSGANMVGNFALPFMAFGPPHEIYNPLILFLFVFVLPLTSALAVYVAGGSRRAVLIGFLLGLLPSRVASKWALHFGTVGASLSHPMLALIAVCLFAIVYRQRREWWLVAVLVAASVVYLSWPVGAVMAVPMMLVLLPGLLRLDPAGWIRLAVSGVVIALLAGPQFYTILIHADLQGFSSVGESGIDWAREGLKGCKNLLSFVTEIHPLILFGGGVGLWFLPDKRFRWAWAVMMLMMLLLTAFGEMWKPQFQLRRTGIPLAYLALVPAAMAADQWMRGEQLGARLRSAALIAILFYTGVNVSKVYANHPQTGSVFRTYPDYMPELLDLIASEKDVEGRILFTGATVHRYGFGHVAYLPVLTGREMMACDYYHFSNKLVEYNYPPAYWRKRAGGMEEFLPLYNVSHVVVHKRNWHQWAGEHPELLTRIGGVAPERPIELYRVNRPSTWFLKGAGTLHADARDLRVELADPHAEAVIKYNYDERLKVSSPAELFAYDSSERTRFIGIRPNGASTVTIRLK